MSELSRAVELRDKICACLPESALQAVDRNRWAAALLGYETYRKMESIAQSTDPSNLPKKELVDMCSKLSIMRNSAELFNFILYLYHTLAGNSDVNINGAPIHMLKSRYKLDEEEVLLIGALLGFKEDNSSGVALLVPKRKGTVLPSHLTNLSADFVQWLVRNSIEFEVPVTDVLVEAVKQIQIPMSVWVNARDAAEDVTRMLLKSESGEIPLSSISGNYYLIERERKLVLNECVKNTSSDHVELRASNMYMLTVIKLEKLSKLIKESSKEYIETYFAMSYHMYSALYSAYIRNPEMFLRMESAQDTPSIASFTIYAPYESIEEGQ